MNILTTSCSRCGSNETLVLINDMLFSIRLFIVHCRLCAVFTIQEIHVSLLVFHLCKEFGRYFELVVCQRENLYLSILLSLLLDALELLKGEVANVHGKDAQDDNRL